MKTQITLLSILMFLAGCGSVEMEDCPPPAPEVKTPVEEPASHGISHKINNSGIQSVEIEKLVKRLGHEKWEVREKAASELFNLGIIVLKKLQNASCSSDMEVRHRAGKLASEITRLIEQSRENFRDAVETGNIEVASKLVSKNIADIHERNELDATPLHMAITNGHIRIAQILLGAGADINAKDAFGDTTLHDAVYWRRENAISYLINKGADINAVNRSGHTPLDEVRDGGKNIIRLLRKHGAETREELENGK